MNAEIPARLNLVLVAASTAGCVGALAWASHAERGWELVLAAVLFSLVGNTAFSLLHEAVHGVLHPDPRINTWLGRWVAAFFPTGLGFQRVVHLGHHRRNRSPVERFDWIGPDESALLKVLQWYGLLTGFFWLLSPLACAAFLLAPRLVERGAARIAEQTSAAAMMEGFVPADRTVLRLEIAGTFTIQAVLFFLVDGSALGWAACYAAFALHWSSLQYADHAWSPLDAREGAWNLRVPAVYRWIFLHYHLHLVHHRQPRLPWIHLPSRVDPRDPQPSFFRIYLRMWRGPRRLPAQL